MTELKVPQFYYGRLNEFLLFLYINIYSNTFGLNLAWAYTNTFYLTFATTRLFGSSLFALMLQVAAWLGKEDEPAIELK